MSKYNRILVFILILIAGAIWIVAGGKKVIAPGNWEVRKGLDVAGGIRVVLEVEGKDKAKIAEDPGKMAAVIEVIRNRVKGMAGVADPHVRLQGKDRIIVELPGISNREQALEDIKSTARLEFFYMPDLKTENNPGAKWEILKSDTDPNTGEETYSFRNTQTQEIIKGDTPEGREEIMLKVVNAYDPVKNPDGQQPLLTGDDIKANAKSAFSSSYERRPVIHVEFNDKGARIFSEFTRKHVGDIVGIFLGGRILTAPVINEAIPSGSAEISGFRSLRDATNKADFLNAGALPVSLKQVAIDSVEATVGKETVNQSLMAGILGLILIAVFMLIYYKLPGLLADIALAIYALLTFAAFKVIGVTMSLPSMAAFILSIGMAVDANILIFERLKEELSSGKTLHAAIDAGFSRAFTAIFDSNACTVITAAVLMWLGTGPVQSFALTLIIGVLISMFTAITVTRTILHLVVNIPWVRKPSWFGLGRSWFHNWQPNIVARRNWFFGISGLIIVPGLVFVVLNWVTLGTPLRPGIEFKSGTSVQMTFQRTTLEMNFKDPVTEPLLRRALADNGVNGEVKLTGEQSATLVVALGSKDSDKIRELKDSISKNVATIVGDVKQTSAGPTSPLVAGEIVRTLKGMGIDSTAEISGKDTTFITTSLPPTAEKQINALETKLQEKYGTAKISTQGVGPSVSKELTQKAVLAVLIASMLIIIYLSFRFAKGGFASGMKYGTSTVIATFHDAIAIVGVFAVLGYFLKWEVDTLFVTALLTVIGFSTHDTIVVFDRIRENLRHGTKGQSFAELSNSSILQTFSRSINTSLTVIFPLAALLILGGRTLHEFYIAMLIGIVVGTYSSIFNATPILVIWEGIASRMAGNQRKRDDKPLVSKPLVDKPLVQEPVEKTASSEADARQDSERAKPKPKRKPKQRF